MEGSHTSRRQPVLNKLIKDLNLDNYHLKEIHPLIGNKSELMRKLEISTKYQPTFTFVVITSSEESTLIMYNHCLWKRRYLFSGEEPELEKVDVPGMKPVWMLTAKIPSISGGTVTRIKNMLLSMSFAESWQFRIYYVGSIVTQLVWNPKELAWPSMQIGSGLQAT